MLEKIKKALKMAKEEGKTTIRLNSSEDRLLNELRRIIIKELKPLDIESAKNTKIVINLKNPSGSKIFRVLYNGYEIGRGFNSFIISSKDLKNWGSLDNLPYGLIWSEVF